MKKLRKLVVAVVIFFSSSIIAFAALPDSCIADINNDGFVDLSDYSIFVGNFLKNPIPNIRADFNNDGIVDLRDYSVLVDNFLKPANCPAPTPTPTPTDPLVTPIPVVNLITNGSFENDFADWTVSGNASITTSTAHDGVKSARMQGGTVRRRLSFKAGKTYKVTYWAKVNTGTTCSGDCWGGFRPRLDNFPSGSIQSDDTDAISIEPKDVWLQKVIHVKVLSTSDVGGDFIIGAFSGNGWTFNVDVDDIKVFEVTSNTPPIVNLNMNPSSGVVPATIAFSTTAYDSDGIISVYRWEFGDGSESRESNPSHTYLSPGTYTVKLTVFDDNQVPSSTTKTLTVTANAAPTLTVNAPGSSGTTPITITGVATASSGQIKSIVWDNYNSDDAAIVAISPASTVNFTASNIPLKPGTNNIFFTATDTQGKVVMTKVVVNRPISGPSISNITTNTTSPKVYEKYEVTFDVLTVADNVYAPYETNPPQNVTPKNGVTVEALIKNPAGQTFSQPAFFYTGTTKSGKNYIPTSEQRWKVRYAPTQTGTYQVSLKVTDASGTATSTVGNFTAQSPTRDGFIQVSKTDSRYFEFSNGKLYFPVGPGFAGKGSPALNLDRPWIGGTGAYSANWARWKSSAEKHGNEGFGSHLSFNEHFPGSELSQYIHNPEGFRMWIGCYLDNDFCARPKSNTTYQVKMRVKVTNVAGPRVSGQPYGLALKIHGWINDNSQNGVDNLLRSKPSWIPMISQSADWHTIVTRVTTGNLAVDEFDFSIYLENATAGQAYVDQFSLREVTGSGLGPELIRNSRADLHTYIEQRPMAYLDDQLVTNEQQNTFLRYVIQDKNDWIPNHLTESGIFSANDSSGYYAPSNTKTAWYQRMWWRYLAARLGYSTAVFQWELNNEGFPDNGTGTHARKTQELGQFMHSFVGNPHLSSTSFWCCWEPTFWKDKTKFPDVDLADIHTYGQSDDMVTWYLADAEKSWNDKVGKPVIRGETGIDGATGELLKKANPGLWFHDYLWVQLYVGSMFDTGYWFSEHLNLIDAAAIATPFHNFVKDLDLNKGGYVDIAATSGSTNLRIFGQKNLSKNKAHAWLNNKTHTWKNVMNNVSVPPISTNVNITMNPNTAYKVQWYNTYTGATISTQNVTSNSSGVLQLTVSNLGDDVAIKITP